MTTLPAPVLLLIAACSACSPPPRWVPNEPSAADRRDAPVYTADGRVLGVEHMNPDEPTAFVRLTLDLRGQSPVHVELAPGWYLDERGLAFRPNERVVVEGKKVTRAGAAWIVARRVRRDGATFDLRDEDYRPLWR
jgi:hypothetical protein